MKPLSPELAAEQKKPLRRPAIELSCRHYGHPQKAGGAAGEGMDGIQWDMFGWQLLHRTSAAPVHHGVTIPQDGSLNRIALNGSAVLHQRVADPGPGADFSVPWNTILTFNMSGVCAIASCGAEILVVGPVANGGRSLQYVRSADNGQSFGLPATVAGTNCPVHAAAACSGNSGRWGIVSSSSPSEGLCIDILNNSSRILLTHSFCPDSPSVYGLAMYFAGDWNIVALVQDDSRLHLKRYVFGAGCRVAAGAWAEGQTLDLGSASVDQPSLLTRYLERQEPYSDFARMADEYEYFTMYRGKTYPQADLGALRPEQRHQVFHTSRWNAVSSILTARAVDNLDVDAPFVCGTDSGGAVLSLYKKQERWFYRLRPKTDFYDADWNTAFKQRSACQYGIALACHGGYLWGTRRNEVWRCLIPGGCWILPEQGAGPAQDALAVAQSQVLSLRQVARAHGCGELSLTLDNSHGGFDSLPSAAMGKGSMIELRIGYRTDTAHTVPAGCYFIEDWTYHYAPHRSTVTLNCIDGWGLLERYIIPGPAEFNLVSDSYNVYQLMARLVQCIGGTLSYRSRSSLATALYPQLVVHAGENGADIMRRLLSLVPDVLHFNGLDAVLIYPQTGDEPGYGLYWPPGDNAGTDRHYMWYGAWGTGSKAENRVVVIGKDDDGNAACAAAADEGDIDLVGERLDIRVQPFLTGLAQCGDAADAALAKARLEGGRGYAVLPPHCGVELWDVLALHGPHNPEGVHCRVKGFSLFYDAQAGIFRQKLMLGEV